MIESGEHSIGWGVVGTGEISAQIVADLRVLPASRIEVASRSIERAVKFKDAHGLDAAHGSFDPLLAAEDVVIIYIGTPHATHSALAVQALEAGKHVLVEKPMGVSAADAKRVADAARLNGKFAMEAMWMKFHPFYRAMLDDVHSGSIGEVRHVRASFGLPFADFGSARWSAERASSTLLDQGIYPATLAYDLLGAPTRIRAQARFREDGVDVTDIATLEFAGGRTAQLAASMIEYIDPSASISGTTGWIDIPAPFWATNQYVRHGESLFAALTQPKNAEFPREGTGYVPMLRAVEEAIRDGRTEHPFHTLDVTLDIARILDQIRAATQSNRENLA